MTWEYTQLSEVAEFAMAGISEALGVDFYVAGKEFDDDNMIFTITQTGPTLIAVTFTLTIPIADVQKAFYTGMPDLSELT